MYGLTVSTVEERDSARVRGCGGQLSVGAKVASDEVGGRSGERYGVIITPTERFGRVGGDIWQRLAVLASDRGGPYTRNGAASTTA